MLLSMTGFGASLQSTENYKVSVEIKSLNHKFFDLTLKLPRAYLKYETEIRNHLNRKLKRGKVIIFIDVQVVGEGKGGLNVNKSLLKTYMSELSELKDSLAVGGDFDLPFLMSLPEVISTEHTDEDPEEWSLIQTAIHEASDELIRGRSQEGQALDNDLGDHSAAIGVALGEVEKLMPKRLESIRLRMQSALGELADSLEFDPNRFEQELMYYIEKLDINEEIVRLRQHIKFFSKTRASAESNGKQLNFIAQEMGREINTIGSKANDASIQQWVVQMKDRLEKIKEQVQNVL